MLMRDMVSAVHYLHTKCIMHRDLKLENFLFATKSVNSPLILIDFGLSKRFEPGEILSQRVGSCYYTGETVALLVNPIFHHYFVI
jgi:calcium-dependent protein kinase